MKRLILLSCVILAAGGCTPAGHSASLRNEVRGLRADLDQYVTKTPLKPRLLQGEIQLLQSTFDEYVTAANTKKEKDPGEVLIQRPTYGRLSSTYGHRKLSFERRPRLHAGIDLSAAKGTAVVAAGAGVVSFVGWRGAYGQTVEINHGEGLVTLYAHMDKYIVKNGQRVHAGTPIGAVGNTGRSTGPHLHFEMRIDNKPVDPLEFVKWA